MCVNLGSEKAAGVSVRIGKVFSKMTLVIFGPPEGIFRYEPAPKEEIDEHLGTQSVYIRKKKVDNRLVIMLGGYVLAFGLFAVMVFWDIFLLSESHDCDDTTIDCFAYTDVVNATSGPINDCGEFENMQNNNGTTTITCYTFKYAFGAALGAIGGLLTMIRTVMKIISATFLWAYSNAGDKCKCCSCSVLCVLMFHIFLVILIPFVLPISFVAIVIGFSSLSVSNIIQIILFIFTLFIGISFPWCFFVDDNDSNEDRYDGHNGIAYDKTKINDETKLSNETTPINA